MKCHAYDDNDDDNDGISLWFSYNLLIHLSRIAPGVGPMRVSATHVQSNNQ